MNKTLALRLSAGILLLAGSWVAYTQNPGNRQPSNKLNKIADDLYEIEGDGGNVAVYITNEGVILVDDKFEYDFNDIVDKVKSVTNQPIKYVLNTHHHGDHTLGNYLFGGATIVAQDRCREEVIAAGLPRFPGVFQDVEWGDLHVAAPFLTYSDGVTLYSGDLRCEVRYVGGAAHTTNDSIVWLPERSVLFTGDLNNNFLAIDARNGNVLYRFNTGGSVGGGVISYELGNKQYVATTSGVVSGFFGGSGTSAVIIFALP